MDTLDLRQGYYSASGIITKRTISPKGDIFLNLFLKGFGIIWVIAPGSAKGKVRFGGALEPSTWGVFTLYKGPTNFYLKTVEVKVDSWELRHRPRGLKTYFSLLQLINSLLPQGHPDDELLVHLFWARDLLIRDCHMELVEWRFLWRWLKVWGLAPAIDSCQACSRKISEGYITSEGFVCPACLTEGRERSFPSINLHVLKKAAMLSRDSIPDFSREITEIHIAQLRRANIMLRDILKKQ
ncbi:MAG TPA: DNA repair protein RecO C-terminal domain-containing protein [Synergistales bacterium]|nr:DNA repair protein RecO C-terminal domain-containing protein [Synergistales bacterium]